MTEQDEQLDLFEFLAAIPDMPKKGVWYYAKCPCGGKLMAIRSEYNGHLLAKCEKCGFLVRE